MLRKLLPVLLMCGAHVFADNLLPGGDFEAPAVSGRTLVAQGGDPTNGGRGPVWIAFEFAPAAAGTNGAITAGLTNEVAHGGKQSLFIDFDHVKTPGQSATLTSNFIPVVSGSEYQLLVWGRTDKKDLITADGRPAYMKPEVDFFAADANTSVGTPFYTVLPIPGISGRDPFFVPDKWNRFSATVAVPRGSVFAQIVWRWQTEGNEPGEINGIMYFDDLSLVGAPNANPNLTPVPVKMPAVSTGSQ